MSIDFINHHITAYKNTVNKGLFVDTNLILLYLIGKINKNFIGTFSRTKVYTVTDYENVKNIIEQHFQQKLITTPNVLTEVNSLANKLTGDYKAIFTQLFSNFLNQMDEIYQESKYITSVNEFKKFGLTDAVIIKVVKNHSLLFLTDDFRLSNYMSKSYKNTLNIRHAYQYNR